MILAYFYINISFDCLNFIYGLLIKDSLQLTLISKREVTLHSATCRKISRITTRTIMMI